MSRYKPYPEYKESGVEWLGEVPEHWVVTKVKYTVPYQVGWTPPTKDANNFEGKNKWVTIGDLEDKVITKTKSCISDSAAKQASMNITPKGSLLFSFKLSVGTVAFAGEDLYTNEAIASFLKNEVSDISYLYYSAPLFILQNASRNIYGAKILNQELISNAVLVLPSKTEQTTIANFLDRETAKIDTLIEKQERLIELLAEKRQALISHAVTKGLDPNVKMKDSGVEWLGEVPEHWKVLSLNRLSIVKRGASPRPIDDPIYFDNEGEYAWVRISDVTNSGKYLYHTQQKLSKIGTIYSVKLESDSLFLSIAGSVGKPIISKIKCCIHDGFVYFPEFKQNMSFLYWIFASGQPYLGLGKMGTQLNLNTETVGGIKIGLPSLQEQKQIADYLDTQTQKIDTLTEKAKQAIALLKERRTALISAVVTGKIDVRGEVV